MRLHKIVVLCLSMIIGFMPISSAIAAKNGKLANSQTFAQSNKKVSKKAVAHSKKIAKRSKNNPQFGVKGAKFIATKIRDKKYSYRQKGKNYTTLSKDASRSYSQIGIASYYGEKFHGRKTASGEIFNKKAFTAAHKTLALGSYALVTNLRNGRKVIVRINDRGPFSHNRIIDLSSASAKEIGMLHSGVAKVKVEAIIVEHNGSISGKGAETLRKISGKKKSNGQIKAKNVAIKMKSSTMENQHAVKK